jgi:integrase/recombinase XerD
MSRTARPWYLKKTDCWYVWWNGKRRNLAKGKANRKKAKDRYKELLKEAEANPPLDAPQTIASVIEQYLKFAKDELSADSFELRKLYLQEFAEAEGWRSVAETKKIHLTAWVHLHTQWKSDWTLNTVYSIIKRPFNWAVDEEIILRNPFRGARHRPGAPRRPLTKDEFQSLLRVSGGRGKKRPTPGSRFRQILIFLYYTGARPDEAARLRWEHIDFKRSLIVMNEHKTARTQRTPKPRIIVLHPVAASLLRLIQRRAEGDRVFLTYRKTPWNRRTLGLRVRRARVKAGIPAEAKLYGIRHNFGTRAILNGVGIKTTAELLGHSNVRMTEHYVHLASEYQHLADAMLLANARRRA